jgi:hypothetical protein
MITRSAFRRKESIIMSAVFPEPVGIEMRAGSELEVKCASVAQAAPTWHSR